MVIDAYPLVRAESPNAKEIRLDIENFVAETLVQIINGAKKAANRAKDAAICFDARAVYGTGKGKLPHVPVAHLDEGNPDCGFFSFVAFDVAVTTNCSGSA